MLTHCILEVWLTKSQEELLAWADVPGLDGYLGIMDSMHMQAKSPALCHKDLHSD